jgi:hypothetical protein
LNRNFDSRKRDARFLMDLDILTRIGKSHRQVFRRDNCTGDLFAERNRILYRCEYDGQVNSPTQPQTVSDYFAPLATATRFSA